VKSALGFVVIIGIVNLLADFTYEGGRSIVGPFLGSLGASATVIGFVAGFGELIGYALRSISGYFADPDAKILADRICWLCPQSARYSRTGARWQLAAGRRIRRG